MSIIGTAGRKEDAKKMTAEIFEKMVTEADRLITEEWGLDRGKVRLKSGGAAWSGK